ncbi:MAG: hypothetical protein V3V10_07225 [Planctomycetota bacterium]
MPVATKILRSKLFKRVKKLYDEGKLKGAPKKWGGKRGAFAFINKIISKQLDSVIVTNAELNKFLAAAERAVRSGKVASGVAAKRVVKKGKAATKKNKTTRLVKKAKKHAKNTGKRAKKAVKARAKSVKKAAKSNKKVKKLHKKVAKKSSKKRGGKIAAVSLMRRRSSYTTSRMAWKSIAEATGLKTSQVKAAHTTGAWRWVLKSAAKKTTKKTVKKKTTKKKVVKKTTTKCKPATKKAAKKKTTKKTSKKITKKKTTKKVTKKKTEIKKLTTARFVRLETTLGTAVHKGSGLVVVKFRGATIEITGSGMIEVSRKLEDAGKAMCKRIWIKRLAASRAESIDLRGKQVKLGPSYIIKKKPA